MKKLLNSKELAEYLNIHHGSVKRMVASDRIPFIRLSKTDLRFDLEEVLKKLKEGAK